VELIPAFGADTFVELLGVWLTCTGAASDVSFSIAGLGTVLGPHPMPADTTIWLTLGILATTDGRGVLLRADNAAISITSSAGGAVVKATPKYRTDAI
jgi:hypothetical protein